MSDNHIDDHLGPVEYLAIEFPDGKVPGEGFRPLLEAVDAGTILVLDLELRRREDQGWRKVAPGSLAADGVDLSVFEGPDSSSTRTSCSTRRVKRGASTAPGWSPRGH